MPPPEPDRATLPTMPAPTPPALPGSVALHGDAAALHDRLAGRVGDFERQLAALASLRAAGRRAIACETWIVADNVAALAAIVELARVHGVGRCVLVNGDGRDGAPAGLEQLIPALVDAVACCRAAGIAVVVRGVPACLFTEIAGEIAPDGPRRPGFACLFEAHCELSERCPGLAHAYVRSFGWEERRLRPVPRTRPWRAPEVGLAPGVHAAWLALLGPFAARVERVVLGRRAVCFALRLGPALAVTVELTPRDDTAPRFARTRSFDLRYTHVDGAAAPRELAGLLGPIVAAIAARDDGTLSLDPRHGLPPLPPR